MLDPQILQAIIAFCAVAIAVGALVTALGFVFNILLAPLKANQAIFEKRLDKIEGKIDRLYDLLLKDRGKDSDKK